MSNQTKFLWAVFAAVTSILLLFFIFYPPINYGGDLAEYYGTTESLINHFGVDLTLTDRANLEQVVSPLNFVDPLYYLHGVDGRRYPVHFVAYSIVNVPVRLFLRFIQIPELDTLRVTNLLFFAGILAFIMHKFLPSNLRRTVFLILIFFSPLMSFLIWHGPDLIYLLFLLLGLFYFYEENTLMTAILVSLASWQSQPLVPMALITIAYYLYTENIFIHNKRHLEVHINLQSLVFAILLGLVIAIPYIYNLLAFGTLTPWTIFQDGWTKQYGFGLQNASLWKFYEQFFDLNMGLFWYAPVLVATVLYFTNKTRHTTDLIVWGVVFMTAFFYQTNPAWHYGTAGYGPTRHAVFMLPFFLFYFLRYFKPTKQHIALLAIYVLVQIPILSFNGFLVPNFIKTLYHNPYATYVLDNYPSLYNPTPEIFVDRTTHTDLKYLSSAAYKDENGVCKKAFVLPKDPTTGLTDVQFLTNQCGFVPQAYLNTKNLQRWYGGYYVNY